METTDVQDLIDLTGSFKIYNNDRHTYIVYEQKVHDKEFVRSPGVGNAVSLAERQAFEANAFYVPIKEGLYKFYFCASDLPMKNEFISYDEFMKEIQENLDNGFNVFDEDGTQVTSWYVKKLIETEKKNLYKYQIRFKST
jgi:hypothetical protein